MRRQKLNKRLTAIAASVLFLASVAAGILLSTVPLNAEGPTNFVPVKIVAGSGYNLAIDVEGYIWAWGANDIGKLGDGTANASYVPIRHNGAHRDRKYVAISALHHSLAIDTDGYLWAWGNGGGGKLGNGSTLNVREPIRHNGIHSDRRYSAVTAGGNHSLALDRDGYLWVWGSNNYGQLGDGTTTNSTEPKRQSGAHYNRKYTAIYAGTSWSYAIDTDGYLWAWGKNDSSQLGCGTTNDTLEPTRHNGIHRDRKYIALSTYNHTLAIDEDGYIWVWGASYNGMLGIGSTSDISVPEPTRHNGVHHDRKYTAISTGYNHSLALDEDGYIWAWGWGYSNALGIGNNLQKTEPTRHIDPLSDHYSRKYNIISACGYNSYAFDRDGYLWAWGNNSEGAIGDGTTTASNSPIQISFITPNSTGPYIPPDNPDNPNNPAKPSKSPRTDPVYSDLLVYTLFGAGVFIIVILIIISFTQRDRKPKKVTIYQY